MPLLSTILLGSGSFAPEVESQLDSNDTRMQQVVYANGKLWGALDTAVTVNGKSKAGIAWYILNPHAGGSGRIINQGYLALANNNLTYPAIAVTPSGRGVMAFTVAGSDYFPSAGYASIDAKSGVGDVHIAALGQGPEDGFTGYKALNPGLGVSALGRLWRRSGRRQVDLGGLGVHREHRHPGSVPGGPDASAAPAPSWPTGTPASPSCRCERRFRPPLLFPRRSARKAGLRRQKVASRGWLRGVRYYVGA